MHTDFKQELNEQQLQVVLETERPLLVLAGAGSGKTRSLIYRCAWLIKEKKVPPKNILMVTFTNKAAKELQERLQNILGYSVQNLWVGTFHHICTRILRNEASFLPFRQNFSIYDENNQLSLLKKIYKEHSLDRERFPLQPVLNRISSYKNRLLLPEDLNEYNLEISMENYKLDRSVPKIYELYQQNLLMNNALDFDDLLLYTAKLLQNNELVRKKYQQQFQYVMIDEYQDTNYAQFEIVHQIAAEHQRICVVGDDDQAIYSFRGATIRNILEFEKDYADAIAIRLEQNYRSTSHILELANAIILNNRHRHSKTLWSELGEGYKPELFVYEDDMEEANKTADLILQLHEEGIPFREIAILYRTNAQSRVFEYACLQRNIPYTIVGTVHFYQRKEIRDLLAYLTVIFNPSDNNSLLRIINEPPRGIGSVSINRLMEFASQNHLSLYQTIQNVQAIQSIQPGIKKKIAEFAEKLEDWHRKAENTPVLDLVKEVIDSLDLINHYKNSKDPAEISRVENLIEFVSSVSEFSERWIEEYDKSPLLEDFLPFVALQTDIDRVNEAADTVYLMTLHNAKGLEFECVFITGLEQELLPHLRSMNSKYSIEEERRLLYVGVTRAKSRLFLSYAKYRRKYDSFYFTEPSIFLQELDPNLFAGYNDAVTFKPKPANKVYAKPKTLNNNQFYIGQKVWHTEYGPGLVLNVDGNGPEARLTISFSSGKLAKIIASYVSPEPI